VNRSPQTLDDLFFPGGGVCPFLLRARGKVPPALLALGPDGPLFFISSHLAGERAKDNFARLRGARSLNSQL